MWRFLGCAADSLAVVVDVATEGRAVVELLDEVGPSDASQFPLDTLSLLGFIPEEELPLRQLLAWCLGGEDRFKRVRVVSRIPRLGADGHRRGREVLHLLEVEVQVFGDDSELGHILFLATRMTANKIRYDLLFQALFLVDAVEDALELIELLKRRLAHESEHSVGSVLGCHLQATADMVGDELAGIQSGGRVGLLVLTLIEQEVVTHTTADEALLHARQRVDGMIDVEQAGEIRVKVGTDLWVDARRPLAVLTGFLVAPTHAIHVGRRTTEIRDIAFEAIHGDDLTSLAEDARLRATGDELALMGRDGAEGTAAETATMEIDRELDHFVGRYRLALVFRMRQTRVGKVIGLVHLFRCQRRIGRIDDRKLAVDSLQQSLGMHLIGLFLNMAEVLSLGFLTLQTLLVRVEQDVVVADTPGDVFLLAEVDGLWNVMDVLDIASLFELVAELDRVFLAHAIEDHVGTAVAEDALHQPVLPIVVVGEPSHGCLNAAQDHGHVGEELLQDLGVDNAGIVRPHVVAGIRTVGVVVAYAPVGCVAVDHGVHGTG